MLRSAMFCKWGRSVFSECAPFIYMHPSPIPSIIIYPATRQFHLPTFPNNLFICQQNIIFASDSTDTCITLQVNFKV